MALEQFNSIYSFIQQTLGDYHMPSTMLWSWLRNIFHLHRLDGEIDEQSRQLYHKVVPGMLRGTHVKWDPSRGLSFVGLLPYLCIRCAVPDHKRKVRGSLVCLSWGETWIQVRLKSKCWVVVLKLQHALELEPDGKLIFKRQIHGPSSRNSHSVGLGWGLQIFLLKRYIGLILVQMVHELCFEKDYLQSPWRL